MLKVHKYRNKKTIIDGITFDSKKEGKRYEELKLLERAGKITDLQLQPRFDILEGVKYKGETLRKRAYVADFSYKQDGIAIVEDVKSPMTRKLPQYRLKRQMFILKYGLFYDFREV